MKKADDRRAYVIKLTPKGEKIVPLIHKSFRALNKKALEGLSERQVNSFYKTLETITGNIASLPSDEILISMQNIKNAQK